MCIFQQEQRSFSSGRLLWTMRGLLDTAPPTHPPQKSEIFLTHGKGEHHCHLGLKAIRLQSSHLPAVNRSLHLCVAVIPEFLLETRKGSGWKESWASSAEPAGSAFQGCSRCGTWRLTHVVSLPDLGASKIVHLNVAGISLEMTSCGVGCYTL